MCTQYGNTNKGCCIPPDTYFSIVYVPDHPVYIVIWTTPHWDHPIWCDDLHLSGAYVCFPSQGRLFCFPEALFFKN